MEGKIVLETGEVFTGRFVCSTPGGSIGKLIFDTRMTGYEKVLTSPEYTGKIVCFTYPVIGSYGINHEDAESDTVFPSGIIVREYSEFYSNFRAKCSICEFLWNKNVPLMEGVDTQHLTSKTRDNRDLWACLTDASEETCDVVEHIEKNRSDINARDSFPAIPEVHPFDEDGKPSKGNGLPLAVLNLGIKKSEVLVLEKFEKQMVPFSLASLSPGDIISRFSGLYVSSGPENPFIIEAASEALKKIIGKIPVFGSGTGHLAIGMAAGGKLSRTSVNHYGENHPVSDKKSGRVFMTAQSHSLILNGRGMEDNVRYEHLNDGTVEGLHVEDLKVSSAGFSPLPEDYEAFFAAL